MSHSHTDCIYIKRLKVPVHVGVPDEERERSQTVEISLKLIPTHSLKNLDDEVNQTINYYEVTQDVFKVAQAQSLRLIETLAENIAAELLEKYNLSGLEIEVEKFIIPGADAVSVLLNFSQ